MPSDFIDDGYTESFYVAAVPGLHGALGGQMRPLVPREVSRAIHHCQQHEDNPEQVDLLCARVIAEKLISWDLRDRHGRPIAISEANVLRMRASLMNKLWGIVLGTRASDQDPLAAGTSRDASNFSGDGHSGSDNNPGSDSDPEGDLGNLLAA